MDEFNITEIKKDPEVKKYFYKDKCDKYDYLIAVGCGAVSGLVDIFLVGAPGDSKLMTWTDSQVDHAVKSFAGLCGWTPRPGKEDSKASAIGFLEKKFHVNYDQRNTSDVGGAFDMAAKNHHMKSLAHSPDIVGLFFSILNQFTSTATFLSGGQVITVKTDTFELQGSNFISKLFCGIANWFGHIMSDVAGSSGAVGRGSGIVIPFYELFGLCKFGSFRDGDNLNTFDVIATKVFQNGYDARFGLTMAIPVVLCDLTIKLIWALKRHFYHKKPLNECIPGKRHDDLRVMLIVGDGVLCLMDGADALIRSNGNCVAALMRMNIFAWFRLVFLVFREVCIRAGISLPLQRQLDAYIRVNEALNEYLQELYAYDIEAYEREIRNYYNLVEKLKTADSDEELNQALRQEYTSLGLELPYKGTLDEFMNDPTQRLVFK